jgi:dihydroorotase-like cyclic amidohydrolase
MTILQLPGLIDVHVHLREPGGEHKETYITGTAAALAGGMTCVLDMPNTDPPTTSLERLLTKQSLARRGARCDVGIFAGASVDNADTIHEMAPNACALKIYVNETFGSLRIVDWILLEQHIANWPATKPIVAHAEDDVLPKVIALANHHQKHLHVAHVPTRFAIETIVDAKERGIRISCEVTPHHLFLSTHDLPRLRPFGEVRPRLASPDDQDALWQHLAYVDCLATDHAPHTIDEKQSDKVPPGMPGLETLLPLMLTAVDEGRLSIDRLIELTSANPRRIFNLPAQPDTYVEVEVGPRYRLTNERVFTKCGWTPFAGMEVSGRVAKTTLRGRVVFDGEQVLAEPGSGKVLFAASNDEQ